MRWILLLFLLSFVIFTPALAQTESDFLFESDLEELQELQNEIQDLQRSIDSAQQDSELPVVETVEVKAEITEIVSEIEIDGNRHVIFTAVADGQEYTVDTQQSFLEGLRYDIEEGDQVYLQVILQDGEIVQVFLVDVVRTGGLLWLLAIFSALIIAVGRIRGLSALIGLGLTILVLFGFIFPQILKGMDPVLATVIGSVVILAINMHLSHGFNKRTFVSYGATLCGLVLAVIFSHAFVSIGRLSGFASEEAILLYFQSNLVQVPSGILLAGFILGAVGVLDDIAITQSETVEELHGANKKLNQKELFKSAMRIGRHHIASTVNTLVLAYAGVAMPLFLLFLMTQEVGIIRFVNDELIAEEIVRTLAGTAALVLTVPIATWFAALLHKK